MIRSNMLEKIRVIARELMQGPALVLFNDMTILEDDCGDSPGGPDTAILMIAKPGTEALAESPIGYMCEAAMTRAFNAVYPHCTVIARVCTCKDVEEWNAERLKRGNPMIGT